MKRNINRHYDLLVLLAVNVLVVIGASLFADNEMIVLLLLALFVFNALCLVSIFRTRKQAFLEEKKNITYRVQAAGERAFDHLPLGIIIYDEDTKVVWSNAYANTIFKMGTNNVELSLIDEGLANRVNDEKGHFQYAKGESVYLVQHLKDKKTLYFDDITKYTQLLEKYEGEKATLGMIVMDNYDEVVKNLGEQEQNDYRRAVMDRLSNWSSEHGILLRSLRDNRQLILMEHRTLAALCNEKFTILDDIRSIGTDDVTLTVSMGIATGYETYSALFSRASSLVDLALSRGGDQIVVKKKGANDFLFYGGKTNPISTQNRVRARVNAGAFERLVLDSDKIVIMGHRFPDADAIGSAIGVLKIALKFEKEAYIVLNRSELDKTNEIFVNEVMKNEKLKAYFISSLEAVSLMTKDSLLVAVDTQDENMLIDGNLTNLTNKVAIFDHHRRGVSYIDATLTYTDPSASSTVELIVDMLDYFSRRIDITAYEASVMLAGIVLDTRRFMYNTSKKTYETAAILKQKGADEKVISKLLKSSMDHYYSRAQLIHQARLFEDKYIVAAALEEDMIFDRTEIAAAADDLLNVQDVKATFVLGRTDEQAVSISARSAGDVNVQLIMEALGGGGHLTNAAVRLEGSIADAITSLEKVLLDQDVK